MTGRDIFKIWAPIGASWTEWVRPVPFVVMDDALKLNTPISLTAPQIRYLPRVQENMAVIVDLPGYDSVKEGLALAALGFRPIPLYNGTYEQRGSVALVDNSVISCALALGAPELKKLDLAENAPPAFLLDSNRLHRFKMNVSIFDNSWDIYDQDMPTAERFLKSGIKNIVLRGERVQKDLSRILYKYQKKGLSILLTDGYGYPREITLKKPPRKNK